MNDLNIRSKCSVKTQHLTFWLCVKARMHKDGRQPHTFRLTVRRFSATNKWFSRESRQAPIPNHMGQKITSGNQAMLLYLLSTSEDVPIQAFMLNLLIFQS